VFGLVVDELRAHDGPGWLLFTNDLQQRARELGLSDAQFIESMHALVDQGLVVAQEMAGGGRWWLKPFTDRVWLQLEHDRGIDLIGARREVLSLIVNEQEVRLVPAQTGVGWFTLGAILRELQAQRLLTALAASGSAYHISNVSPLARRALHDFP
jgi:hypothetical protein